MANGRDGSLIVAQGYDLHRYSADGVLASETLFSRYLSPYYQLVELANGQYALLVPDRYGSSVVGLSEDGATELWRWESEAELYRMAELADGFGVGGSVDTGDSGTTSAARPYLARIFTDGASAWEWLPENETARGSLDHVLATDEAIFTVSTEDPVTGLSQNQVRTPVAGEEDPLWGQCSAYGCLGLVVRRFDFSGELEWEFQYRSETSAAKSAALYDGALWVLVEIARESTSYELMRFDLEPSAS